MRRVIAAFIILTFPLSALAITPVSPLTRRDGFLMIWESVKRPAQPAKSVFKDIPVEAKGSLEIDYAASRSIIGDKEYFRPDESMLLKEALVWLMRTRNVTDDPAEVNIDALPVLLKRYPIADISQEEAKNSVVTSEDLQSLIHLLDTQLVAEEHEVSLYAEQFHGDGTAFGETFDMHALTAAHRSLPHNTLVKVTNVSNGKSVIVRINDRGPFVKGRDMDLSLGAFTSIENRSRGKFMATFERLGDAGLVNVPPSDVQTEKAPSSTANTTCNDISVMQRRIGGGVALKQGVPGIFALGETLKLSSPKRFVVRGVTYPDGNSMKMQDYVFPGESFTFKPFIEGEYVFTVGSIGGKKKRMKMRVMNCEN